MGEKMKITTLALVLALFLAGCTLSGVPEEVQVQTRVAQILTTFPTPSFMAEAATNTVKASTPTQAPPTAEPAEATATLDGTEIALTQELATQGGEVTAEATVNATATATDEFAAGDIRLSLGAPTWLDPMDSNKYYSPTPDLDTEISFLNGQMQLKAVSSRYGWRLASIDPIEDFYLEMTGIFESCSGLDSYGLIFRVPVLLEADRGYLLGITCDGSYYLKIWDGKTAPNGEMTTIIAHKFNGNISQGSGQPNRLGVRFVGSNIRIYINGAMIHEIADTTWAQGYFGVFINQEVTSNMVVNIEELAYWTIK